MAKSAAAPLLALMGNPPRDGCAETCESIGKVVHDKLGIRFIGHEDPVSASDKPAHIVPILNSSLVLGVPEHAMELDFRTQVSCSTNCSLTSKACSASVNRLTNEKMTPKQCF